MKIEELFEKTAIKSGSCGYGVHVFVVDEGWNTYFDALVDSLESFVEVFGYQFGHERVGIVLNAKGRKVRNDNKYRFRYIYNGVDEMVEIRP